MRFVAALLGIWIAVSSGAAYAAGRQNFTLINRTGLPGRRSLSLRGTVPLTGATMSSVRTCSRTIGRSTSPFPNRARACKWDMRVVFSDGDDAEWDSFDLCTVSTITIRYNRQKNETWAEYE